MILHQAGPADLPAIARLHAECFIRAWDEAFLARLLAAPGAVAFVGTRSDAVAGFVLSRAAAGEAEIVSLGVSPGLRRRGIGAQLVRAVCRRAFEAGVLEVFLEVSVTNAAAQALYAGLGFCEVGRRPDYYEEAVGAARDALVLGRALPIRAPAFSGPKPL
ncbi:MAG: ribosomal protein S18-alanine N-acetyltransferase [Rhizomicrobium sp.]